MGALPKPEPILEVADVIEVDGRQAVQLPTGMYLAAKQMHVVRSGEELHIAPMPVKRTREQVEAWFRSMDELDAGEVIPGGRDQRNASEEDPFPGNSFDEILYGDRTPE
jgi:virulence-associated protein VagC